MTNLSYTVYINPLIEGDYYATIQTSSQYSNDANDLGMFFDLTKASIKHSILDLNAITTIDLTINSYFESVARNKNTASNDVITNLANTYDTNNLNELLKTLVGRVVQVVVTSQKPFKNGAITKVIYTGYICKKPFSVSVKSGTQFTLTCRTLLSQLNQMSSNDSWNVTTQQYKNVFTTVSTNKVNTALLFSKIVEGTLINSSTALSDKSDIDIKNLGNMPPLPNNLWALIVPNKTKLEILREILIAYNRIIWQDEDGTIYVQPLYINDFADYVYNVDILYNGTNTYSDNTIIIPNRIGNYLDIQGVNNAAEVVNRVDVIFALPVFASYKGNDAIDNQKSQIFASAPFIDRNTNQIIETPMVKNKGEVDYVNVYKTSTRLYNSGKWTMATQKPLSIDDALSNNIMSNVLNSADFKYSNVWYSNSPEYNKWVQFYSQLFLAEINVTNYNVEIIYDYNDVVNNSSPLAKIITINNYDEIDYEDNICIETVLSIDSSKGSNYKITTAPLLSITATWDTIPQK
jgi:hypothetical protein